MIGKRLWPTVLAAVAGVKDSIRESFRPFLEALNVWHIRRVSTPSSGDNGRIEVLQAWVRVSASSPYPTHDFLAYSALDTFCFKTPLRTSTPIPSHSRGSKCHKENKMSRSPIFKTKLTPKNVRQFETSSISSSLQSRRDLLQRSHMFGVPL